MQRRWGYSWSLSVAHDGRIAPPMRGEESPWAGDVDCQSTAMFAPMSIAADAEADVRFGIASEPKAVEGEMQYRRSRV